MRMLLVTALLFSPCSLLAADNWNQYRGPDGNGQSKATGLPLKMGEGVNVKWKVPIDGKAWSSPVVWDNQIWLTNAPVDGKKLWALCFDVETGKQLHKIVVFDNPEPQFCHPENSYATPTPVVEEGRLYVHFGAHGTACLDTKTGMKIWERRDLKCDHFRGPASSPIVYKDHLIVAFDGFDVQYVVALNKQDGTTVWRKDRAYEYNVKSGDNKKAYCTASVFNIGGREEVICPGAVATEAFDPDNGKLLWTVRHGGMNASGRPLYGHGLVFITNGMGRMVAVRPEGTGDITEKIAWESGKGIPKKSSQLLIGDLLYMVADNGVASAMEAETGDIVWTERLGGEFAASPLYAEGRIYTFNKEGDVKVLAAGDEFKLLAEGKFDAGFMASPAVVGKSLILRTTKALYRVSK